MIDLLTERRSVEDMPRKARFQHLFLPLLTAGALGTAACQATEGATAPPEKEAATALGIRVRVLTLEPTAFDDRLETTGSLEADDDVTLSARAAGTLESLASLGARVRKGAVVARIDSGIPVSGVRQAVAAREAALASLELAKENYDRQKPLFDKGVISALEFQSIHSEFAQARAQLAQTSASVGAAKEQLENTRLVAPFKGVVDAHFVDEGEQVNLGAPVVRVLNAQTLIVKAGLPERYAADISVGAEVQVSFPAYGLAPRTGRVRFVATAIDPRSRTFDIEVSLGNQDGRLKPEMVARLMVTRARIEEALVAPQDAVLRDESGQHVFVVENSNGYTVARRKSVEIGGRAGGRVVIKGVESGGRVVVLGQTKLTDGDFVDVAAEKGEASL